MQELFVYYRIRAGDEAVALQIVDGFQAALRQRHPQLGARLLRRSEPLHGPQTWMEIYAVDPAASTAGVDTHLQGAIESAARALAPHIEGKRHTEVFVDSARGR